LPEIIKEFEEQLEDDEKRWGDTWKYREKKGQEERTYARYEDYIDQFRNAGVEIPWMKIVGGAFICWVREQENG
jgi:hypothetical protein